MQCYTYSIQVLPDSIIQLADILRKLPGVGKRSSQKLALDLLSLPQEEYQTFLQKLTTMRDTVQYCTISGVFSETSVSPLLSDPHRNQNLICVVQEPTDALTVEKSGIYNGVYHVLFQLINPLENSFVENTTIEKLIHRIKQSKTPVELVFFLKNGFATDTTVAYIKKALEEQGLLSQVKLTRFAQGLPMYFSTDYLDQATMMKAFEERREVV